MAFSGTSEIRRRSRGGSSTGAVNTAATIHNNNKNNHNNHDFFGYGSASNAVVQTTTTTTTRSTRSSLFLLPPTGSFFDDGGTTTTTMILSSVNDWPTIGQAGFFVSYYIGLLGGTILTSNVVDNVLSKSVIGLERWRINVIDSTLPVLLGIFYLLAGSTHFAFPTYYQQIYRPPGTWGIWYLPGSAAFHVAWTGLVEILGGIGLSLGVILNTDDDNNTNEEDEQESLVHQELVVADEDNNTTMTTNWLILLLQPLSSLILFLLTIVVTPANIYMATIGIPPTVSVSFHWVRFGIQILLLTLLLTLAKDSFFFAWGEELD